MVRKCTQCGLGLLLPDGRGPDEPHLREVVQPFHEGARLRMGTVRRQNEALTSLLLMGVCTAGEDAWRQSSSKVERKVIEDTVCFMLRQGFKGRKYLWSRCRVC